MITITIKVNAPLGQAIGIKEHLAMCLERFGDTQVVDIREDTPKQETFDGFALQKGR